MFAAAKRKSSKDAKQVSRHSSFASDTKEKQVMGTHSG
ncbi:hypothetical protein M2368_001652 [Arthrobacter sp. JUb119]|nr:hypothetical protein [Arthrobacter sp. JUb119]